MALIAALQDGFRRDPLTAITAGFLVAVCALALIGPWLTVHDPLATGAPRHPYSAELLAATPQHADKPDDLHVIRGQLPDLAAPLLPCRFATRCGRHQSDCDATSPPLSLVAPDHFVACRHPLC